MRKSSLLFVFFLAQLYLCSCHLIFPYDNDLAAQPSYVSPEMTFRSFTAAVRNDIPELEYKCFSESFKDKYDMSLSKYSIARARVQKDNPNVSWIGRMTIDEAKQNDERNGYVAVSLPLFGKGLLVRMVRQDYAFILMKDGSTRDFFLSNSVADTLRGAESKWMVILEDPILRGIDRADVVSLQLLPEWKIASFEEPLKP